MFSYRWRWLRGHLAQLLPITGLLFVNKSVSVSTSRSEVKYLGLVVVVIFGIALVSECNVPHCIFYVCCLSYICLRPDRIIFLKPGAFISKDRNITTRSLSERELNVDRFDKAKANGNLKICLSKKETFKNVRKEDIVMVLTELGDTVNIDMKLGDLKQKLLTSKEYLEDSQYVKDFLISTVENRKKEEEHRKQEEKIRCEERPLEREYELELARIRESRNDENRSPLLGVISKISNENGDISLDKLIKGEKSLTIPVARKTESRNLLFDSLERAYKHKKVHEELQAEILSKNLGDKVLNVLVYIKEKDLKHYAKMKALILKEFEPTPQVCLENFRRAKRNSGKTHIQFVSRLTSTWEYYCKLFKAEDYESLKDLFISDKLFQALDNGTASHKARSASQEAVVVKEDSSHLQSETVQNLVTPLKKISICIYSKEIEGIIDSGTQISIIHSTLVPDLQDKDESNILLTLAFSGQIEEKICRFSNYYKKCGNNSFNSKDTLNTVADKLNVPCLLTPRIYEVLVNSVDVSYHLFDDEISSKEKVLTLHSEAIRWKRSLFSPQQTSEDSAKEEKSEKSMGERRSHEVSPSTETEIGADEVMNSNNSAKLQEKQINVSIAEGSFPAIPS
ncbi:hypothetical protein AVEN_181004-1 [Araneus ventricosus]|uniref:Peptidase A2 domain-containing protein n=1 Tax=Araneus ventricosus TaxID=182803 RepID=A0A4Y2MHL0_ARAVE|nr:hypothetical protein AVEN_181004-1 [Araneus ventricosus]